MIATLVDWGLLAQAVYVSVVVGIGVLVVAAFGVSAALRAQDQTGGASTALYGVTAGCVRALAATIAIGIYLLAQ